MFQNPAPVISSFTQYSHPYFTMPAKSNYLGFDGGGGLQVTATFNWSVAGATRFELYSPGGLTYSGTASGFTYTAGSGYVGNVPCGRCNLTYTLKAFNGAGSSAPVATQSITILADFVDENPPSG